MKKITTLSPALALTVIGKIFSCKASWALERIIKDVVPYYPIAVGPKDSRTQMEAIDRRETNIAEAMAEKSRI